MININITKAPKGLEDKKIVGESLVKNRPKKTEEKVYITTQKKDRFGFKTFTAWIEFNGKALRAGHIKVEWLRTLEDGTYGSEAHPGGFLSFNSLNNYGFESETEKQKNKVNIEDLESRISFEYRGIGTSLVQTVIEWGLRKNCEGRIMVFAGYNSHAFYHKVGFKSLKDKEIDRKIEDEIKLAEKKNRMPYTERLLPMDMYIEKPEREKHIQKIKENPILEKTKSYLKNFGS